MLPLRAGQGGPNDLDAVQQDPATKLRLIRAASSEAVEETRTKVRNVDVTWYSAKLDLARALETGVEELGGTEEQQLALLSMVRQLKGDLGVAVVPIDVYVDDEGLLRRTTLTSEADGTAVAATTDYFDFGVDVEVDAPPREDVFDITQEVAAGSG